MPTYSYRALDPDKKIKNGLVEARNENEAADTLKDKGYEVLSVELQKMDFITKLNSFFGKVKPKDLVVFSRQFAVLISANVALVQSLKVMVNQTENEKMKATLSQIADEVDGGTKLSDALAKRPAIFTDFFVNVVKSGESSGKLDEVLNYVADELEKDYDMSAKIKGAMIYPVFVFCGLAAVGSVMMIFVVPKLTGMITEAGGEPPLPTKILMAVSAFMSGYWYIMVAMIVGAIVGFKSFIKLPFGKRMTDIVLLRLPVFGRLLRLIYLIRFTRTLQTLIIGGVTISNALQITADVVGNVVFEELIRETKKEVEDGNSISTVFINSDQIPVMVSQMLKIGEKTGKLDMVLEKITEFYSREIDNITANLMTLMEPIIMVVMGVGVGIMVAAIVLPMYQVATSM